MVGASENTQRVTYVNANWVAPADASIPGLFELLIVTEDDERHTVTASPEGIRTVLALLEQGTVFLRDGDARILIVANIVGTWLPEAIV